MRVLVYLAKNAGEVVEKNRIIKELWESDNKFVGDDALSRAIYELRKALGDDASNPQFIEMIPRRGYRLIAPVCWIDRQERYQKQHQIGQGGMGRVFLAQDTRLGRNVALKFLRKELQEDRKARKRLVREAKAAAALDHPYICKVYETGESDGDHFIAMEYVPGTTLAQRLREEGALTLNLALKYAIEIAEALSKAHQEGIVHRDLKPSNIMLVDGHVKVMDFGIAKRIRPQEPGQQTATDTLTDWSKKIVGSSPYASPEQIRDEAVDERSDIFSFGILFYEMLTGVHPFKKRLAVETVAAILHQAPSPLPDDLPAGPSDRMQHLFNQMLARDRENRYSNSARLLEELKEVLDEQRRGETATPSRTFQPAVGKPASIAVLLPASLSPEPDNDHFSYGLGEQLLSDLSSTPHLKVPCANSSFRFGGRTVPEVGTSQVGELLGVENLLESSVRRAGKEVCIAVRLIHSQDGYVWWSKQYDSPERDVLLLQREIAREVAARLGVKLRLRGEGLPAQKYSAAHDLYFRGRTHMARGPRHWDQAVMFFKEALNEDPAHAEAHASLAVVGVLSLLFLPRNRNQILKEARESAESAVKLDPGLAWAHLALGYVYKFLDWDFESAERSFRRAIEIDPNSSDIRGAFAELLCFRGRFDEGLQQARIGSAADPLSSYWWQWIGGILQFAGRNDEAIEFLEQDPPGEPVAFQYWHLANAYLGKSLQSEGADDPSWKKCKPLFLRARELAPQWEDVFDAAIAFVEFRFGSKDKARKVFEAIFASKEFSPALRAFWHELNGDPDAAFESLKKGVEIRDPYAIGYRLWFGRSWELDPRIGALLDKYDLPERPIG